MALSAAARCHSASGNSTGAFPGQSWCELLGDSGTLQRAGKDTCPFLVALVTFGLVGSARGPGSRSGAEGTLVGFLIYQPSGECPGEAAQPLQMGVFPLDGCLLMAVGGGHRVAAPLPCNPRRGNFCSSTCRCSPIPSVTALGDLTGSCCLQLGCSLHFNPLAWSR